MALSFIYSIWPYIKTGLYLILGDVRFNSIQFKVLFRVDINHTYNTSSNELLKSDDPYVPFLVVVVRWCHPYVYTYPCPPCVTGVHRHWFSPHRTWVDIDGIGVV